MIFQRVLSKQTYKICCMMSNNDLVIFGCKLAQFELWGEDLELRTVGITNVIYVGLPISKTYL